MHKSGFVNIIGNPNVGKSSLMNKLVGERMSIITHKPQTTRHRILGIVNDDEYQIVFSDTPGYVNQPSYRMHKAMNRFVLGSFDDADVVLFMTDITESENKTDQIIQKLGSLNVPVFLVMNKIDISNQEDVNQKLEQLKAKFNFTETFAISALENFGIDLLLKKIISYLPEGPAFYPKDQLTDKPERFFVSEIIREKILTLYKEEIPYSCEVIIDEFKEMKREKGDIIHIHGTIYVSRKSQKAILIGKEGKAIKKLGTMARKDIEVFVDSPVFLQLYVKVKDNWRDDDRLLRHFGYNQ